MANYEKRVRELLSRHGCLFVRNGRGDNDIRFGPITHRNVTVDGIIKSRRKANAVEKRFASAQEMLHDGTDGMSLEDAFAQLGI